MPQKMPLSMIRAAVARRRDGTVEVLLLCCIIVVVVGLAGMVWARVIGSGLVVGQLATFQGSYR